MTRLKNVSLHSDQAGWLAGQVSVCGQVSICGKNFNFVIFSDTVNMINVKLCMMVVLIELYLFISLSVTLIVFQVTAVSNSFN